MDLNWINLVMGDPLLHPSPKVTAFALAAHADDDNVVKASLRELAETIGGNDQTWRLVGDRIATLTEAGFVQVLHERKGRQPATYRLTLPTDERQAPAKAPRRPTKVRLDIPEQVREWIETDPEYREKWLVMCDVSAEELDEYLASTPRSEAAGGSGPEPQAQEESAAPEVSRPRTIAEIEAARRLSAGGA